MINFYPTLKASLVVIFVLALASAAQAQTRTWVSGVGDDLNPCSRTAPCKTFAGAISEATAPLRSRSRSTSTAHMAPAMARSSIRR
jgi:hypothetical protein